MGAKDSSGDWDNLQAYIRLTQDLDKGFKVLSGNDSLILKFPGRRCRRHCRLLQRLPPPSCPPSTTCSWKARSRKHEAAQDPLQASVLCSSTATPTPWSRRLLPCWQPGGRMPPSLLYLSEEGTEALRKVLEENKAKGMA